MATLRSERNQSRGTGRIYYDIWKVREAANTHLEFRSTKRQVYQESDRAWIIHFPASRLSDPIDQVDFSYQLPVDMLRLQARIDLLRAGTVSSRRAYRTFEQGKCMGMYASMDVRRRSRVEDIDCLNWRSLYT